MDPERDELRRRHRLARASFGLIALGVGLLCLNASAFLAFLLTFDREILNLVDSPLWEWLVGSPITWFTVLGTFLLWGCADDPSWRRRAGLLVAMHLVDLGLWLVEHGPELGLEVGEVGHEWFRTQLGSGIGWAEFLLFLSLATDLIGRLGRDDGRQWGHGARLVSTVGLIFWAVILIDQTDWNHPWPMVQRPNLGPKSILTLLGSSVLLAVGSFQVTTLCLAACRYCSQALADLGPDDAEELLRSRSEAFGDDPRRWWDEPQDDPWR